MNNHVYRTGSFLQKRIARFPLKGEIKSIVADSEGRLYALADGFVYLHTGNGFKKANSLSRVQLLKFCCGSCLAATDNSVFELTDGKARQLACFDEEITAIGGGSKFLVLTEKALYSEIDGVFERIQFTEGKCLFLAEQNGRTAVATADSVHRLEGKRNSWRCIFPIHSTMPKLSINCIEFDKTGMLWIGADEGLWIYDYKNGWYSHKQLPCLPQEKVFDISFGAGGVVLCGTQAGAVLIRNGRAKYLPATRYAYSSEVISVAIHGENTFFIASNGGVVEVKEIEMTLKEKAEYFFTETEKYFPRKDGFVSDIGGIVDDDIATGTPRITDNDGLWTQSYITALSMAYAVEKDERLLKAARRCKDAMLVLTRAPEIPGFTARAVRYPDEKGWGEGLLTLKEGDEWHRSSNGAYEWLGETSSDEMTGHYMGFSMYYDLCADEAEKKEIAEAVKAITDHILEHNGYLCDFDGKPTTWACWNPDALNNDSMWVWEKGVNSLEMLCFLKVTYHMTGDEKYNNLYLERIQNDRFLINAAYHKREDGHRCHIDDNLAMCASLALLRLEKEPTIRRFLLMGLETHWQYERIEDNPFYNILHSAFTGNPSDIDSSVRVLEDYSLDMIDYYMINSSRLGLTVDEDAMRWSDTPQFTRPLAIDERPMSRLCNEPFKTEGCCKGRAESGMSYLFMYWLGRFFGIIE